MRIVREIAKSCKVTAGYLIYGQDSQLAERLKMKDPGLPDILRIIDKIKKTEREGVKWVIHGLLNNK